MRLLAVVPLLAACASSPEATPEQGAHRSFVVDDYTLPTSVTVRMIGSDLNGDGDPDNALGNALVGVVAEGFTLDDAEIRSAIAAGLAPSTIEIFDDNGDDPSDIVGVQYLAMPSFAATVLRAQMAKDGELATLGLQAGPMTMLLPAILDAAPMELDFDYAQMQLASDGAGGYDVAVQGLLDDDEVKEAACAAMLQLVAADPPYQSDVISDLGGSDGALTTNECLNSQIIAGLLKPDVIAPGVFESDQPAVYLSFAITLHASPAD